jgi:hypothetical protein
MEQPDEQQPGSGEPRQGPAGDPAGEGAPNQGAPGEGAPGSEQAGDSAPGATPEKDPSDWVTGEEPMTGPQKSYLQTLCQEAGEEFDEGLTKAEASRKIDELQQRTGRGK